MVKELHSHDNYGPPDHKTLCIREDLDLIHTCFLNLCRMKMKKEALFMITYQVCIQIHQKMKSRQHYHQTFVRQVHVLQSLHLLL